MPRSLMRSRVPEAGTGKLNPAAPDRWRRSLDTMGLPLGMSVACCAVPFSPRIIESLLAGSAPPEMTLAKVLEGVPLDWAEQRQRFGFSSLKNAAH